MTVRIAIAGKGGTGKTTVSALLCGSLINRGVKPLLAVDADPNSCLPDRLGLKVNQTIGQLREDLRSEPDKKPAGISKTEWIERLINEEVTEALGFDMIVMGRQEGPDCYCYINNLLRSCLDTISRQYQAVIIDNEAGLEHLSRRSNGALEVMLVVCQPTLLGARTAARIMALVKSLELDIGKIFLVLNGCDTPLTPEQEAEFANTGLEIIATIPTDPNVLDFEMQGKSLMGLPPDSPAPVAVNGLVSKVLEEVRR